MRHHLATAASAAIAAVTLAASWAAAQSVVLAVAALCGALVGIVAAVRTISGLAPVRWLWRQLVGAPVARAIREQLDEWAEQRIDPRLERIEAAMERIEA